MRGKKKAAQVAARLIEQGGGKFNYMHLMKMLYAIERTSLAKWGQPVTGGDYFSMKRGPVISEVLNLIKNRAPRGAAHPWFEHFETKGYDLILKKPAGTADLSRAEVDLIDTVFVMLGHLDRWDVVQRTHDEFKEWENPGNTSKPIHIEKILQAVGKTEDEIKDISRDASYYNRIDSFLSR